MPPDIPNKPLVVTAGEPAGIGPDLCLALADSEWAERIVVVADPEVLTARATMLGREVAICDYVAGQAGAKSRLSVLPIRLSAPVHCGRLDPTNAKPLLAGLSRAIDGCQRGEFSALITGPLQKSVINDAGIKFTGHTEFLAEKTGSDTPVMLLAADEMRVALASIHMPLREVPDYLTSDRIATVISVLHQDLIVKFGIEKPRIVVCGLNPHAGESGHLGSEDNDIVLPAIETCRARDIDVRGPMPADTAFTPIAGDSDVILAMYHDQGLPVIKYASFGHAVNVTLGLPIIRTSVDHGTALALAGRGSADPGSMLAAVALAVQLADRQ